MAMNTSPGNERSDRALRAIVGLSFFPGFALLLTHGIITHQVLPALAIIPMTGSLVSSIVHLSIKKSRVPILAVIADTFLAAFLLGLLIPSMRAISHPARWSRGAAATTTVVGTYATVFCLLNLFIHSFFVLRWSATTLIAVITQRNKDTCPHCHGALSVGRFSSHRSTAAGYEHVETDDVSEHDSEESAKDRIHGPAASAEMESTEPRPSTDDETARLV